MLQILTTLLAQEAVELPEVADGSPGSVVLIIAVVLLGLVFAGTFAIVAMIYGPLWFQAYMSNSRVSIFSLIGMTLRQVNARTIVVSRIMAMQAGVDRTITTRRLEAHFLAGGNVPGVIRAIIAAHRADIPLDFDRAAAIDLAGRDVLEAVQTSVYPKVIDCPDRKSGKATLSAIAKNGVELKIRTRVTVRTNISQLIGGATEETVIARVGEGIITAIGSAENHLVVMENPDLISKAVLARGLDAQTAFEIVSIDIADIDVGENIGARLQADQAEADTRVARAKAEERRANATAREQEMKAQVSSNRAAVVLAEAEVPLAMATAFREGNLYGAQGALSESIMFPAMMLAISALSAQPSDAQLELLKTFHAEFIELTPGQGMFPATFTMGGAAGPEAERPPHQVTLRRTFHVARYEVPQNLWEAVMGGNPSRWKGPRNSVEMLSFAEAQDFCRRTTALMRSAGLIDARQVVRLPTEAEWEYAARAGTATRYSFGNDARELDAFGWHTGNAAGNDPPVGAKKPNPWGLYDVHGYLWEWCADAWHGNYEGAPADGSASRDGDPQLGVVRGGSWKDSADRLTSSFRHSVARDARDDALGLRCVLAEE